MDRILSDAQRCLAEQYHGALEAFIRKKRIDYSDYYDALAIGYCNGISAWDASDSAKKDIATLPAFLFKHLDFCLRRIKRDERLLMRKANYGCLSLNHTAREEDDQGARFIDLLVSDAPEIADLVCGDDDTFLNEIKSKLRLKKDKDLIECIAKGGNVSKIALEWGVSRQCVSERLQRIRKQLNSPADTLSDRV